MPVILDTPIPYKLRSDLQLRGQHESLLQKQKSDEFGRRQKLGLGLWRRTTMSKQNQKSIFSNWSLQWPVTSFEAFDWS